MGLVRYKQKRSFSKTPEPRGGRTVKKGLRFVVQKHDASHLHYDFRLEMDGVLKSWAVPKGPSMDPKIKRLAMAVEDHPMDYRSFEGIIPKGQYGGGTVIVWDEGFYDDAGSPGDSKILQDRSLLRQYQTGKIHFSLHGKRLQGEFALVKTSARGANAWLLMKLKDEFASADDVLDQDESVISGKTIDRMAGNPDRVYGQKKTKTIDRKPEKKTAKKSTNSLTGADESRKSLLNPAEETQARKINGHEIKFTNLSKVFWPDEGYTKRDLINYYYQMAPFIVPYIKDRPHSLNRHPNGIEGKSFYQKDVTGKVPPWISTYLYHSAGDTADKHFLTGTDEASLLYMVSLGCIEINPWSSRIQSPDNPDWCIIDLDPDNHPFDLVIEAANVTRNVLDSMKVPSYCKTSGSTGLHIYIPLGAKYSYEQSKTFARLVVALVTKELPGSTTIERTVASRKGKIYLDFLQNRPQATLAAPYSVRPKPGATVSMPLHWEEVKKGLKMSDFTIVNAARRMKTEGDIFKPVMGNGVDITKIIKSIK